MKALSDWSIFEKILLFGSIIIVSAVGIIFKSDLLTTLCSIIGIITVMLVAKGKTLGLVFGLLITLLYSIVSYRNQYYGEILLYLFIMAPMFIIGIINWIKHKNKKTKSVEIATINEKEVFLVFAGSIVVFIGIYYLLKLFNTNELIISSLSVLTSSIAIYLQVRRSKYCFAFYIISDIVLMILWGGEKPRGKLCIIANGLSGL